MVLTRKVLAWNECKGFYEEVVAKREWMCLKVMVFVAKVCSKVDGIWQI
jgi:hypothetical protein